MKSKIKKIWKTILSVRKEVETVLKVLTQVVTKGDVIFASNHRFHVILPYVILPYKLPRRPSSKQLNEYSSNYADRFKKTKRPCLSRDLFSRVAMSSSSS